MKPMVSPSEFQTYLDELCRRNGLGLNGEQLSAFYTYLRELQRWNRVHNLTALRDWREIALRHFCDSLTPVLFFRDIGYNPEGKSFVDVGSGAGFPGVPLKIYYGEKISLTLAEVVSKKCAFLTYLKKRLNLNYRVRCGRAEEIGERFNIAITRALEVRGKGKNPLEYADRILSPLATDLVVILKGKRLEEKPDGLGYRVYELEATDFKGLKILYKFV